MKYQAPKGTQDILPDSVNRWQYLEGIIRRKMDSFCYREIVFPTFEYTELFERSIGEDTDIVTKEMYTFTDKGDRSLTLRPEGTASVIRSYVEHGLGRKLPLQKLFYIGPMYRQESPQSGRQREFYQFGAEAVGSPGPEVDAEVIHLLMAIYDELGLRRTVLRLGSVGCPVCRPKHREALLAFLNDKLDILCDNCRRRYRTNPLRILDCKEEDCRRATEDAPSMLDYLCGECSGHFGKLKVYMDDLGIGYTVDRRMVRGLDYYTKTAFEVEHSGLGAQSAIGGGGRYDGLVEEIGGDPTPGIGFAAGIERTLLAMESDGLTSDEDAGIDLFIAPLGEEAGRLALKMLAVLRDTGIKADTDYLGRSLKSQMKESGRMGAKFTLILGERELNSGKGVLRDMRSREQVEVPLDRAVEEVETILKGGT